MLKQNYLNKIKDLPEFTKQFGGLLILSINCNFFFFFIKYNFW